MDQQQQHEDDDDTLKCRDLAGLHKSLVQEAQVLHGLVCTIVASKGEAEPATFKKAEAIIEKYQEQGQLLEPHLESLITPLMGIIRAMVTKVDSGQLSNAQMLIVKKLCRIVHTLITVCGYKTVVKFFPHQASDLEPTVALLEQCHREVTVGSILKEESTGDWETKCTLLLWLSILVLIPFDMASVDTAMVEPRASNAGGEEEQTPPLVQRMVKLCTEHLSNPGPTREMTGVLLSRLLTRPDMQGTLKGFMAWTRQALATTQDGMMGVFLVPGIIGALAGIFKVGGRDMLLNVAPMAWQGAHDLAGSQAANRSPLLRKLLVKLIQRIGVMYLPPRIASWRYMNLESVSGNMQLPLGDTLPRTEAASISEDLPAEKLWSIGSARVGIETQDEDVEVPDVMEEVIEQLLSGLRDKDTVVRWSAAKGVGRVTARLSLAFADDVVASVLELFRPTEGDGAWHGGCLALAELARRGLLLPERLPTVVPVIVQALHYDVRRGPHSVGSHVRDAAAYVCWAFVRAYSSSLMIPHLKILAPALLTTACYDREVNCRRAAAAAFQEGVGRQGDFLHGIDIVNAADYFSLGTRSNAYRSVAVFIAQYEEYRLPLIQDLLTTKICHWDRSLRELSAEALAALVKYDAAYFETTVMGMVLPSTLSTDLSLRHGATLASAEVIRALYEHKYPLTPEREKAVAGMVPAIEKARLYRGKGGEIMRSAVSRLIEYTALVEIHLSSKIQKILHDSLDENLKHPNAEIQACAVAALQRFVRSYLLPANAATVARTTAKYITMLKSDPNPAARRGAALAFSALPYELLAPLWKDVVDALCAATLPEERLEDQDAETRVNAVRGLSAVCEILFNGSVETLPSLHKDTDTLTSLASVVRRQVMDTLFNALDDYAIDNRGDVGSWVREAAMEGLKMCTFLLCLSCQEKNTAPVVEIASKGAIKSAGVTCCAFDRTKEQESLDRNSTECNRPNGHLSIFDVDIAKLVVGGLAKQAVEKIDRVRDVAGRTLQQLLHSEHVFVPFIPHRAELEQIVPKDTNLNWAAPGDSFPRLVQFLNFPEYRLFVLSGIVISVGGLADSLGKVSSQALIDFLQAAAVENLNGASGDVHISWLGGELLHVLKNFARNDRVIIPALKPLDLQFSKEVLEHVKAELHGCKDVAKLLAGINVLSHFVLWPEPARSNAIGQLLTLLSYRYPKVRKVCAEQVYLLLIQRGDELVGSEAVEIGLELIGETAWDGPMEGIREKRETLFSLFHLQKPASSEKLTCVVASQGQKQGYMDENESYAALINAEEQF
ncbi:unnamed protein product [Sphagnum troendelagicum]